MVDQIGEFLTLNPSLGKVGMILAFLMIAWIIHLLAGRMAGRIVKFGLFTSKTRRPRMMTLVQERMSAAGIDLAD